MVETTVERGASNETRAAAALCAAGYELVERNYACAAGELDIVAVDRRRRRSGVLVFIEVRSRSRADHGSGAEMVSRAKQRRVAHIAAIYLAHRHPPYDLYRFDVVAITGDDVQIIEDAWRLG